jgi:hypothetical protein
VCTFHSVLVASALLIANRIWPHTCVAWKGHEGCTKGALRVRTTPKGSTKGASDVT